MDSRSRYTADRRAHWDRVAASLKTWRGWGGAYHKRVTSAYRFLVPPGLRVLEVGCGQGDLLAACHPTVGVGVDFSSGMIEAARRRHPELHFAVADAGALPLRTTFDVIILSDLLNDVWDVQDVLAAIRLVVTRRTRLILNFYSRLWEVPLATAESLGVAKPALRQNWLTIEDVGNLLHLEGYAVLRAWREFLFPLQVPLVEPVFNRFLVRIWPFHHLAMSNFVLAAGDPTSFAPIEKPSVTLIVPARNEAGNIAPLLDRLPLLGQETEIIFVEGHSNDETYDVIEREIGKRANPRAKLVRQQGTGKGDAVRRGFAMASGDILAILDADLSVRPEDLPRFVAALQEGKAEFANGVRLVYPMEGEAMRFLNLVGNRFFSLAFSWLLGQTIKDTLCGTKALWRADYQRLSAGRAYFGDFDPFGDFDLLFGAAKLGLRIVDVPVRYQRRTYGKTNIKRWRHGWLLVRMAALAAMRLKFT
jgi:SAM-dependent methyltransferase